MKLSTQITITAVFFLAVLLTVRSANAQLLIPHVTIDVERLPDEAKLKLTGIDSLLADYLRDQEWAGDDYNYDFEVDISIFFTDYSPDPALDKYKAKLVATNRSDVRFEDTRWEFGLRQPYQFRQGQFDAFKSVVEFYVWMLFGTEYDKLEKLGGRTYYEKARQIYLQSSGQIYYFGWDKRYDLLRESVDDKNQFAREFVFFYDTGMYFDSQDNPIVAKDYLYWALVKLQKVPFDKQEQFLNQYHREFAEALLRAGYPKGLHTLAAMDPAHRDVYESLLPAEEQK